MKVKCKKTGSQRMFLKITMSFWVLQEFVWVRPEYRQKIVPLQPQ